MEMLKYDDDGFNSQPPEGGWDEWRRLRIDGRRFNSQPPEGGWVILKFPLISCLMFQLTAARRRLANPPAMGIKRTGFNSQPPEGGWV